MSSTITTIVFNLFFPLMVGVAVIALIAALRDGLIGGIVRFFDALENLR